MQSPILTNLKLFRHSLLNPFPI